MDEKKERILLIIAIAMIAIVVSLVVGISLKNQEKIIEIGIYSGNEWGVPQIDVYRIFDEAIEAFESKHPGVKVIYRSGTLMEDYSEWLASKILLGKEPDVMLILEEDFNTLSTIGVLEDLSGYIERDPTIETSDYYQVAYEAGNYNGAQYGLPMEVVPTFMIVNQTLLKANGLYLPYDLWDYQSFLELSASLTRDMDQDRHLDQFGFVGYEWDQAYYALGGDFVEARRAVDMYDEDILAKAIAAVATLHQLNEGQVVRSYDFDIGHVGFKSFSLAEYRAYKPYPYRIKKYDDFEWEAIAFPSYEGQESRGRVYTVQWGMSSRSNNKETAWDFIKFMTHDDQVQHMVWDYTYALPTKISVVDQIYEGTEDESEIIDAAFLKKLLDQSVIEPTFKDYNGVKAAMDLQISLGIMEEKSTQEIINSVRKAVDGVINQIQ